MATSFYWRGGAGDFGSPDSWDSYAPNTDDPSGYGVANVAPSSDDFVDVETPADISGSGDASVLYLDSTISISGTTTANTTIVGVYAAGTVTVTGTWANSGSIVIGSSYSSSLTVGAGDVLQLGSIVVVSNGATGDLEIEDGGQVTSGSSNGFEYIGYAAGSDGTVTVDGAGSSWASTSAMYVGWLGDGTLTITDGGSVNVASITVGSNYNGPATADETGTIDIQSGGALTSGGPYDNIGGDPAEQGTSPSMEPDQSGPTTASYSAGLAAPAS
jgi:T5SS/PEP-CTERM-associated repeat protein